MVLDSKSREGRESYIRLLLAYWMYSTAVRVVDLVGFVNIFRRGRALKQIA